MDSVEPGQRTSVFGSFQATFVALKAGERASRRVEPALQRSYVVLEEVVHERFLDFCERVRLSRAFFHL